MKYRVIKECGMFYPQMKQCWYWRSINADVISFDTEEEAIADIQLHKKIFGKRKIEVVYEEG